MKLNIEQLTAAAFIFEKENGNILGKYELETIDDSGLKNFNADFLIQTICDSLNNNLYEDTESKISAYWALSKLNRTELLPSLQNWLKIEYSNHNTRVLFQIMVAIDNLDEQIFNTEREGRSYDEDELNIRDAHNYLKKLNAV